MEVIERSCDVVEESTEPSRNETKTAKNNDKAVVYLSITVATLVVVILAGVLVWFVSRSKRKAKKKHKSRNGNVTVSYSASTMKEDGLVIGNMGDASVYDEPVIKRSTSGGIENTIFGYVSETTDSGLYTTLNETRDTMACYQSLSTPSEAKDVIQNSTSVPTCKGNTADGQEEDTAESIYQAVDDDDIISYIDVLPARETGVSCSIVEKRDKTSICDEASAIDYLLVLPQEVGKRNL